MRVYFTGGELAPNELTLASLCLSQLASRARSQRAWLVRTRVPCKLSHTSSRPHELALESSGHASLLPHELTQCELAPRFLVLPKFEVQDHDLTPRELSILTS